MDGYEFLGLQLEVRFSDSDTAKQYPASKYNKKKDGKFGKRDGGDIKGKKDYHDEGKRGFGRGGRGDEGVKRRNTYDYDRDRRHNDYGKGSRKYDDDYDDEYYDDYDDEYDNRHNTR